MRAWRTISWAFVFVGMLAAGCGDDAATETAATGAVSFEHHECAACGMIVREQPAPRGQLVHRDGTRAHFCAISDLAVYVGAPSPHGAPTSVYVEVMAPDTTPDDLSTDELSWSPVDDVSFVIGDFERPVMGQPVLTFSTDEEGGAAAARLDGRAIGWEGLLTELARRSDESQ
ncbi:MAG: nitrous oxide reductase accessory protein NosL [Deltaproteobacteria bacterium]|nr:nitrous oxide reductase accessory protein NosL [Deltaproteobacteria bacterium]